jgi:hypothetical protein
MYYLMLSPADGQSFAFDAGFSMPSEEVQEAETYDVISRWALLTSAGVLEDAIETADWLLDLEAFDEVPTEMLDHFKKLLIAHGMGLINRLLDSDKTALISLIEMEDDDE